MPDGKDPPSILPTPCNLSKKMLVPLKPTGEITRSPQPAKTNREHAHKVTPPRSWNSDTRHRFKGKRVVFGRALEGSL